jgi:Uma2 family endonuclease
MAAALRLTIQDLEGRPTPHDDQRYELIDGELSVSTQPHWRHQFSAANIIYALAAWSRQNAAGMVLRAPGVVFANDTAVAPDVVWVSKDRLDTVLGEDGKLHAAPDLVVELLSPGLENQRRDREAKLSLYSRQGLREYWIVDWQHQELHVYRRRDARLELVATLLANDVLQSPMLPALAVKIGEFFRL